MTTVTSTGRDVRRSAVFPSCGPSWQRFPGPSSPSGACFAVCVIPKFQNSKIPIFSYSHISPWSSFGFLSLVAIVGFWCLTSRVLLYYLFPVIPMFVFFLVLHYRKDLLWRLVPWGVALTLVAVAGGFVGGMFFSDKMRGVRTEFHPLENHYAYEFYHGRKTEAELGPYRKAKAEYLKRCAERKAREAAK